MSQTFGRRAPQPVGSWLPESVAPVVAAPPPAAVKSDWKPSADPEFAQWQTARRGTRWKTWGMAGLMVLGGPMSFFMPEGIGQWAGWALMGVGAAGLVSRFRKPPAEKVGAQG